MTDFDAKAWEEALIEDIRAHDGRPSGGPLRGHPLLVMHATGARSGEPRRAILTYSRDGAAFVVAGTAGGSTKDPAWVSNVRAHPDVTIEIGRRSFSATATIAPEDERRRLWDAHVEALPWFAGYAAQVDRPIPMIRLTPKAEQQAG
jgi:deazaflavin-dependent oxidoreductase (nitroreductase family)